MSLQANAISAHLRTSKRAVVEAWELLVRTELLPLVVLDRSALLDHLPEFIEGLARWVEGDAEAARSAFTALAEGHAAQRLHNGIDLETLTREYALLRSTIMRELLAVPTSEQIREPMVRVNEGLDVAIHESVRRYTHLRDRVRDRFVGILAHDLRNPLGAISMASATIMARTGQTGDELHRLGVTISRSAERMARMIDDVIEFARGHLGGGIPVVLAPGDLGDLARQAVDELRIGHPERRITFDASGDLRGQWDRDRVIQAVSNLISNALQYGHDPIAIVVREAEDRQSITLTVNNQGPPIAAERLSHLFDPLQLETSSTRRGLGLGLYIVRQIALAHGAHCEVSSTEEEGTTFSVHWPRTPVEEVPAR
jgi:signal transduction histidine kinase